MAQIVTSIWTSLKLVLRTNLCQADGCRKALRADNDDHPGLLDWDGMTARWNGLFRQSSAASVVQVADFDLVIKSRMSSYGNSTI